MDTDINLLPDEMLLHIFEYLHREDPVILCQVCSRWRRIAEAKSFWWNKGVASVYGKSDKDQRAFELMKKVPVLGILNVYAPLGGNNPSDLLHKILQHCNGRVRKLRIGNPAVREDADWPKIVQYFGGYLEGLEFCIGPLRYPLSPCYLHFKGRSAVSPKLQNGYFFGEVSVLVSLSDILDSFPLLRTLRNHIGKIVMCLEYKSICVISEAQNFLDYFCSLKELCFYGKSDSHVKWILGPNVTLDIRFCRLCASYKCFGDDVILDPKSLESVRNLIFRFPYRSCSYYIWRFLKRFPQLKELNYTVDENCLLKEAYEIPKDKLEREFNERVPEFSVCYSPNSI